MIDDLELEHFSDQRNMFWEELTSTETSDAVLGCTEHVEFSVAKILA